MLLLVTIGLVVIGFISLVIGFASDSLGPIYISIGCSVLAGVILFVFARMARRSTAGTFTAESVASGSPGAWSPTTGTPAPISPATSTFQTPSVGSVPASAPTPTETVPAASAFSAVRGPVLSDADDGFPIAGYDTMRASQIVELLETLGVDELEAVQEREESTKNRATVLRRVVERIDKLESADGTDLVETILPVEESASVEPSDDGFPLADYDNLSVEEILAVLDDLEDDELDMVAEREEQGRNRVEILDYIDDMFEEVSDAAGPAVDGAVTPAPARVTPATKVPAKKVPAKKASATKVPAKKAAPAAKAPATVVKKAVAKAPAAAAPAKKVAAKKVAAKKVVAKAPATTSAVAKKAAPAKAAAKKAPAAKKA